MTQDNEQERYKKFASIANVIGIGGLILAFISLILAIVFDSNFFEYAINIACVFIIVSLMISTIPYILEKNIKKVMYSVLIIIVLAYMFFR